MLAAVLMVLALAGGVALTFFIMDAPRRRAVELHRRLEDELAEARRDRRETDDRARRLADQARDLRAADADLARRAAEFDRRVVTSDDLAAENRLLKADARNLSLAVARLEALAAETAAERATLVQQRDLLGQAYLEEVRAGIKRGLTVGNYPASKRRLETALARLEGGGVRPTPAGRDQLFAELRGQYELAVRADVEREAQARLREQVRDEQRRQREAEDARRAAEQAERDRQAVERALQEALRRAAGAHAAEVDQLRAQLAEAQAKADAARAISLAQITKSGFVYVIANLGSFGPDVFKIGLTRREQWQDRVDELGGAAVPFPFEVHLVLTSDDAPALEAALHRAFRHRRVNRANPRKEFFRVRIEEVVQAAERHDAKVEYRADPEALEYLESQSMTDAEAAEVAAIAEQAEQAGALTGDED